jgi:isopentenyldiphosphate isomerase
MNFVDIPSLNLINIEMEERLLIYDAWGTPTGISTRSIAHTQGFIHASVHGFGYTDLINGKRYVLVQKRSQTKKINPGRLDYMYAGHMSLSEESFNLPLSVLAGSEFIKKSFINEGNEELKINMNNKAPLYCGSSNFVQILGDDYKNYEKTHMFLYQLIPNEVLQIIDSVKSGKTDGEVESVELVEINEYFAEVDKSRKLSQDESVFVPRFEAIQSAHNMLVQIGIMKQRGA